MYTSDVPTYDIDLGLPEEERWAEVIRKEKRIARRVVREASADIPQWLMPLAPAFKLVYEKTGGRFVGEMEAWAEALEINSGQWVLLNCTYELSHAGEWVRGLKPFGCTAGVRTLAKQQVHVRNMDWPLKSIGAATRIFRFYNNEYGHDFVVVGVVGFVGALSGMVPGAYSVTLNWAPPDGRPKFDFGPAFLLREVLEICSTYEEAVTALRKTPLATSVFFTACGAKRGQACVIERTHGDAALRKLKGNVIVQANHHVALKFRANNECLDDGNEDEESRLEFSRERAATLEAELAALPATAKIDDVAACLDIEPVNNDDSYQQMLFVPATGEVRVWRWVG